MVYVYTSITNCWDDLRVPSVVSNSENVRYLCFTNIPNLPNVGPWQYRPLIDVGSPGRTNRVPKILPHLMLPSDAEYSIYHDGNFQLSQLPEAIIETLLKDHDWAAHRHPARDCIYDEADVLLNHPTMEGWRAQKPERIQPIIDEMKRYRDEGYPAKSGLWANGMIVRRHTSQVKRLCEAWWSAYACGCERDQISFPPVRRSEELAVNTIDAIVYDSPYMHYYWHSEWKNQPCTHEFLPERARTRDSLERLKALTGTKGFSCPEF